MFGGPRWASLDDLLLHAALGLDAARVARLLREEEWEEELQVLYCLCLCCVTLYEAAFVQKYLQPYQHTIGSPPVSSGRSRAGCRWRPLLLSCRCYPDCHSLSFSIAKLSAVLRWCHMAAQEASRLARALHAAPDSTAAFWEARQHTLDKQASYSSCITGLVSKCQIYHVCHAYATQAGAAS